MANKFKTYWILIAFFFGSFDLLVAQDEHSFIHKVDIPQVSANDLAEVIYESSDGAIWLAFSYSGLYRYNGYTFDKKDATQYGLQTADFNRIIAMHEMKNGKIYLCSRGNGLFMIDFKEICGERIDHLKDPSIQQALQRVWSFFEDKEGKIWMATWRGLVLYNPDKDRFNLFQFSFNSPRPDSVHPSIFRCVMEDPDNPGILWISGITGLFSFDKSAEHLRHHRHPSFIYKDGHRDFDEEHCQYLMTNFEINGNDLYLSSWGGGIMHFNKKANEWNNYLFDTYKTVKTLDENICNRITFSGDILLFTSDKGTGTFNMNNQKINYFETQSETVLTNTYALLKDKNNKLWMSSYQGGIYLLDGDHNISNPLDSLNFEFNIVETENETLWSSGEALFPEYVRIPPHSDSLYIEFALINPFNKSNVEYQYRLEGYERDWLSNGRQNHILLSGLKGGKYMLKLRAREESGKWTFSKTLEIERSIYFYQKLWVWLLAGSMILLILIFWIRQRVRRSLEKEITEKRLIDLKMQALQAQMNPHFIFNALNSINNYILKNDSEKASDYLNLFSKLIRAILNNSGEKLIPLEKDLEIMRMYLEIEKQKFSGKFEFVFDINEQVDPTICLVPPMVIQPYIENAIWHGLLPAKSNGKIEISYTKIEEMLKIEIIDNGIGRDRSGKLKEGDHTRKRMGMSLAGDRIDMLNKFYKSNADVKISDAFPNKLNTGTKVLVRMPYITQGN